MSILWFFLGIVIGWGISVVRKRAQRPLPSSGSHSAIAAEVAHLREQLHQTELAYHMAVEMSQLKGNFLARTSHELRSPMNGIIGMHQLILAGLSDSPEEEREFIAQANASALKMVKVLDDVIDAAKLEHGATTLSLQPIQLVHLLREVHTLTYLQAQNRNLRLTIESADAECYIIADPQRLRQVLVSLVDAAIAQMEEGAISVTVASPFNSDVCQIQITSPVPLSMWLDDEIPFPREVESTPLRQLDKETTLRLANQPFPNPSFVFRVARSLMQSMRGQLDITTQGDKTPEIGQIECRVPRVLPEPSIN